MRACAGLLGLLGLAGCGGWSPGGVLQRFRAEAPSCSPDGLTSLSRATNGAPIHAQEWADELRVSCPDLLSEALLLALDQWAGAGTEPGKAAAPSPLCQNLVASSPLIEDRERQMAQVYTDCNIERDGLFDPAGFAESSGPFGGLLASRLYAELLEAQVPASRAVALSKVVAGSPSRAIRSVYGDHSSYVWRVPLMSAAAPRVTAPGCTPTIVVDGETIWWQDRQWGTIDDGRPVGLVAQDGGPPFLNSGMELAGWQSSRPACEGQGKTVLVAVAAEHGMELLRPLLWTLDGVDGYRPAFLVRRDAAGAPLSEVSPVGALGFRMIDVQAHEAGEMDSLFLLPAMASDWPDTGGVEASSLRGSTWLPGLRLEISSEGWRLYRHGELSSEDLTEVLASVASILEEHRDQVQREGIVLTLGDALTGEQFVRLLAELQDWTDVVMVDARPPREHPSAD